MEAWEFIFRKEGKVFLKPHEDMRKVVRLLKKEKVKRVLDLGCGSGRHTVMLAKLGFEVHGTDISKAGLKLARKWLSEVDLKARLKHASCYKKFPFRDNFFDAVISTQVIHHNYIERIRYCISEIERVLRPGGIVFIIVTAGKRYLKKGKTKRSKKLEPRTYLPLDGREKGLVHYIYTKQSIKRDFRNFKILDFHKDSGDHYCLLGKLKKGVMIE